ncbi:hypothetical protein MTR67_039121 [Solanum verrucosum]|uniref:Uncharacterized protein n=1 Tax=Solanum verrucosum TaxID=315347 RepID=A0AAF0ZNI7_SOLVR|nr:hypothetical protein MTR67_039121 [Solanum verrucosum]
MGVHQSLEVQRKPGLELLEYHYSCGRTKLSRKLEKEEYSKRSGNFTKWPQVLQPDLVGVKTPIEILSESVGGSAREDDGWHYLTNPITQRTKQSLLCDKVPIFHAFRDLVNREHVGYSELTVREAIENWEVEDVEPLCTQTQLMIQDKEKETSLWLNSKASRRITGVYAPNIYIERRSVWEEIGDVRDDTLIFCGEEEQLKYLRVILVLFEGISGLHINWRKSFLYPINEVHNMEALNIILGGQVGALPTTYLGMPLGAKSMSKEIWSSVIEKCEKKLARWKGQYLSLGGRVTLINSVLDAMPTYMMSLFPIPVGVIDRLDRIRRKFLWRGNKDRKGYNLVKWNDLIIEKRYGGLGIKNLQNHSKDLRMKWLWKYANDKHLLWRKVIKAKYEVENRWMTKEVFSPYGVNLWRSIRALWDDFKIKTRVKVRNREKTSFWGDN